MAYLRYRKRMGTIAIIQPLGVKGNRKHAILISMSSVIEDCQIIFYYCRARQNLMRFRIQFVATDCIANFTARCWFDSSSGCHTLLGVEIANILYKKMCGWQALMLTSCRKIFLQIYLQMKKFVIEYNYNKSSGVNRNIQKSSLEDWI